MGRDNDTIWKMESVLKSTTSRKGNTKRGIQQLTDAQKLDAICKVQNGETKAAVAREYGVPESTLRGWCKKAKINVASHVSNNNNNNTSNNNNNSNTNSIQFDRDSLDSVYSELYNRNSRSTEKSLVPNEITYRDCSYSKGSPSDEGSTHTHVSSEQEDEELLDCDQRVKPPTGPEDRVLWNWLNQHYRGLGINYFRTEEQKTHLNGISHDDLQRQGWFYNWCKAENVSELVSPIPLVVHREKTLLDEVSPAEKGYGEEPLSLVVYSKRRLSEDAPNSNKYVEKMELDDDEPIDLREESIKIKSSEKEGRRSSSISSEKMVSAEEALRHGEIFLSWLQECSHPNVSLLQAMQIANLIKNIRSSLEKNQN